ncbi:Uncharacterised protein [Yersinia mollaretii]|nr:Uncharacterised protein [Yersinia mollaretii]
MMPTTQAATLNRLSLSESDTNLIISGQLQKILQVTFGYLQTAPAISVLLKGGNSNAQNLNYETCVVPDASNLYQSPKFNGDCYSAKYSAQKTPLKNGNSPSLPAHRNLLIKLNCAEMELANSLILSRNAQSVCREIKGEQCSGSAEHYRYSGSSEYKHCLGSVVIRNGCNNENQQVTGKEKGGTENTALCGYGFFHHEENQHVAARQDLQLVRNYSQNPHMLNDYSNLSHEENQHLAEQHVRTCEILVGQPFGSISRCLSSFLIMRFIQAANDSSPSCRWASSIKSRSSGSSRNWNGGLPRLSFLCVDTLSTPDVMCLCVMTHYMHMNEKATPRSAETLPRRLTTNDRLDIEAAMLNHTPTRFKFLFLAVCRSDLNAKPHRESVTAHSEQDARRSLAGQFVLSFAGRIPAQGVCNA